MMLVYVSHITPRVEYIFGFILNEILGIDYELTSDKQKFETSTSPRLNYSDDEVEGAINIKPHTLLFETEIKPQDINVAEWEEHKIFFQTNDNSDLPYDLFAASFYLGSRYEEYLPFEGDEHGRFKAEESLAFKNGFVEEPVVDQWAYLLADIIKRKFPDIKINKRKFNYISTIDIDNAYAFLYKGFKRTVGASVRSLLKFDFNDNITRFKVFLGLQKDPFDTYDYIEQVNQKYSIRPINFFLAGEYGLYDKNISVENGAFQKLIKRLSKESEVAIHPSYHSKTDQLILDKEKNNLAEIIGESIEKSRQHFLKMALPETYQRLVKAEIKEDHTMGYASVCGFRAGTCTPFSFYDLSKERQEELKIVPFCVMDRTLSQYLGLNQEEALLKIDEIVRKIKAVDGTFVSLWHNETFSDWREWKGWKQLYEKMVELTIK